MGGGDFETVAGEGAKVNNTRPELSRRVEIFERCDQSFAEGARIRVLRKLGLRKTSARKFDDEEVYRR